MDFCRNMSVSGEYQKEQLISAPSSDLNGFSGLDDLFSAQHMEPWSLEWLSVYVEDCLTSTGNCLPTPTNVQSNSSNKTTKPSQASQSKKPQHKPPSLESFSVPSKARSKRKRAMVPQNRNPLRSWSCQKSLQVPMSSDPPLLQQAYWMADSELLMIVSTKEKTSEEKKEMTVSKEVQPLELGNGLQPVPAPVARKCSHCLAQRTPQWRAGPMGPKTLCNACGVRYKSGRLLPEYRPAKSPTFVSHLHSNSHKKVMEIRNGGS